MEKKNFIENYEAPQVEIVEVEVEKGLQQVLEVRTVNGAKNPKSYLYVNQMSL